MLSFLYVYSDHSILECYNLFSGVELSMRSFFVIIGNVDISKISLSNLISYTDSRLWNFIYLLTMNKSLREKVEKNCGVDWSCHLCTSNESETLGERTSKILMVISLCLFICNDKASLMQLLLSDVVASFSGSSELNRIFNQLGITVSYETIHR